MGWQKGAIGLEMLSLHHKNNKKTPGKNQIVGLWLPRGVQGLAL